MRALLVHNPFSRRRLRKKEIDIIVNEMSVDYTTDIFETKGQGSITEYIKNHGDSYDLVIACGGDGTIHEAACGILLCQKKPKLALIPRGTMNDVARCYKMPKSVRKCVKIIQKGNTEIHSTYRINDTFFLYGMAIGRYAAVSYVADKKRELGRLAYYLACVKEFFRTKPIDVTINGNKKRLSQVFILNTNYLAGYKVDVKKSDNISLHELRFKNKISDTFRFFFFLTSKAKKHSTILEDDEFIIEGDNLFFTLDGERYISSYAKITKNLDSIEIIR